MFEEEHISNENNILQVLFKFKDEIVQKSLHNVTHAANK